MTEPTLHVALNEAERTFLLIACGEFPDGSTRTRPDAGELTAQGVLDLRARLAGATAALPASPPAEKGEGGPTCQACGGDVQGWHCQSCDKEFKENDAGHLVFVPDEDFAQPVSPSEGEAIEPRSPDDPCRCFGDSGLQASTHHDADDNERCDLCGGLVATHPASDQSDTERMRAERENEIIANAMCLFRAFIGGVASLAVKDRRMTQAQSDDWKAHAIVQHERSLRELADVAALAEKAADQSAANGEDIELEDEIECPVCQGFGFLETKDGTVECDECDGNGSVAP